MLIEFTVGNFTSFKEKVTLSMVKSRGTELLENTIRSVKGVKLLKSAVIYGANASGKSNLLLALDFVRHFVRFSFKTYASDDPIPFKPFLLNTDTQNAPSFFEITILVDGVCYRYGFELDEKNVRREWLYQVCQNTDKLLFERNNMSLKFFNFPEAKKGESIVRNNCLLLSTLSHVDGASISSKIVDWFKKMRRFGNRSIWRNETIIGIEKDPIMKSKVMRAFVSVADPGIKDFSVKHFESSKESSASRERETEIYSHHDVFNPYGKVVKKINLNFDYQESAGTRKMFDLSVPIISVLEKGGLIVADEFDAYLHPALFKYLVGLFNSSANKGDAQLIFATHNLVCMNSECFRRDQIWFTEKNGFGESSLFSLAEYKNRKIRNDASYAKNYLLGKYGAVPYISQIVESFK